MNTIPKKSPADPKDLIEVINIFNRLPEAAKPFYLGIGHGLLARVEIRDDAGIEIIRVMSNAYDLHVPCFVDNAESVNTVSTTGGQMILLKVTDEPQLTYMLI